MHIYSLSSVILYKQGTSEINIFKKLELTLNWLLILYAYYLLHYQVSFEEIRLIFLSLDFVKHINCINKNGRHLFLRQCRFWIKI